jgi:predicted phage terminase large subunit-like protein
MCERLTRLKDERGKRIIFSVGPQRGKSEIVSRYFPAWWLGHFPKSKNIISSYAGDLADGFNIDAQRIMEDPLYKEIFPGTEAGDKKTQGEFHTSKKGVLYSVGVGGSTTGKSAGEISGKDGETEPGFFDCDDPIKDLADVFSITKRKAKRDWWKAVVETRIHRTSHVILMHTRWGIDDLAGWLLKNNRDDWEVISFPEIGSDPDYPNEWDTRDPGEASKQVLWEKEKGDYDALMKTKKRVGSFAWNAMYQQKPRAEGGNQIKDEWLKYYTKLPILIKDIRSSQLVQSWDCQFKEDGSSFTVGVTLLKHEEFYYLVDYFRNKCGINASKTAIRQMYKRWPQCSNVLIEDGGNGAAIHEQLKTDKDGRVPSTLIHPKQSKVLRLMAQQPVFENGFFHLPEDKEYTETIKDELITFPLGANDDIVDAISQGLDNFGRLTGLAALIAASD